jgi:hypothetical protein
MSGMGILARSIFLIKKAAKLGVTEQKLIDALGIPPHPPGEQPKKAK